MARCRGSAAAGGPTPRRARARGRRGRGDLERRAAQGDRAPRREPEAHDLGRGQRRHGGGRGRVTQPRDRAHEPVRGDHPPLQRHRLAELDQLLVDGGEQRLPRHGPPAHAQLRLRPHHAADQRVVAEGVVERAQVVVDAGGEAHAGDAVQRRRLGGRAGGEQHAVGRGLHDADVHRLPVRRGAAAAASARAGGPGRRPTRPPQPERPGRLDLDAELDRGQSRRRRWTSTRKEFDATISPEPALGLAALAPRRPVPAARHDRHGGGARHEAGGGQGGRLTGRHGGRQRGFDDGGGDRDGQPVDDLRLLVVFWRLAHELRSMTDRVDGVTPRCRRLRPEHAVPVRRADPEARLVVLEVMAHVQLAQPPPDGGPRPVVVHRVMDHVVGQVAGQEPGAEGERVVAAQHEPEQPGEQQRERDAGRRRHHEPHRVVGMIVVDAVDHPVQARAEPALGLEVEDDAVEPVLHQRPDGVAAHDEGERVERADARDPEDQQRGDDGEVEDDGHRRMHPREPIQQRGAEHRWGGLQVLGVYGALAH